MIDYNKCLIGYIGHDNFVLGQDVKFQDDGSGVYISYFDIDNVVCPSMQDLINIYNSNPELYSCDKDCPYFSWNSEINDWSFDLELYKEYTIENDMEIEFQNRLNSKYPLADGFLIKPKWKELFASIEAGLKSSAENPLGNIVGVDMVENKIMIDNISCINFLIVGKMIRVKNSFGNDGFYTISDKYLDGTNTVLTVEEDIPSEVADGDICLDFCYLRSADKITYKLVTSENMNSVGAEIFNICNRIYESKYIYESNLRSQETKEGVDNILQAYINS